MTEIKHNPMDLLSNSHVVKSSAEIATALDKLAGEINEEFAGESIIFLAVMKGAMIPGAKLAERLTMPLRLDYVHATRYLGDTSGGEIHWVAPPTWPLEGERIVVFDDIFDEGHTIEAIQKYCYNQGASDVKTAVLVRKLHDRGLARDSVDFVGMDVPDEYIFGCGMDVYEYWRQLDEIRVMNDA
jgi:hypoxanthine phosphoribosyltransferase